jgi:CelD/BcsL family acetyltransferase involved in cellulose biosynthesis
LQPSFDAYLASLGKSTRKDFRKTLKKFASADQPSKLAVFSAVDECQKFFDDALIVSKKTWQYLNEGAGLKDQDKLLTQYRIAAERGWFRSYILYYGEQPVAFQEGYVYGATYYAEQIGYDPAFASHQIGVVLLLEMIRDLIENCPGIQCVDLGATENELKRRVSAAQVIDGYSYIFRRDAKSASLLTALRMANGLTDQLKKVLGRESSRPKASRPQ